MNRPGIIRLEETDGARFAATWLESRHKASGVAMQISRWLAHTVRVSPDEVRLWFDPSELPFSRPKAERCRRSFGGFGRKSRAQ
jgi:hypothetical protein